jgi:hypothetical protein
MTSKKDEDQGPTWAEWLQARMDEQGLNPFSLAERASAKLGRRVHASSIQRQLSGERGIQHELAQAIAAGLGLPETTVFRAAGLLTEPPLQGEPTDPHKARLFRRLDRYNEAQLRRAEKLLDILEEEQGGQAPKTATTTKRARGRTDALVPAG